MTSMLASVRPGDWNVPLLVHVFGALLLVGALATAATFQLAGSRRANPANAAAFDRLAFRTLLLVAVPAWILMRIGAQWIYSKEGWSGNGDPAWLGVGFSTADLGGILILVALVATGLSPRRRLLGRAGALLTTLVLIAYVVTLWAMSAKPS
jgi:hypothetical protein